MADDEVAVVAVEDTTANEESAAVFQPGDISTIQAEEDGGEDTGMGADDDAAANNDVVPLDESADPEGTLEPVDPLQAQIEFAKKRYSIKPLNFVVGFDVTAEEEQEKAKKRAARFGMDTSDVIVRARRQERFGFVPTKTQGTEANKLQPDETAEVRQQALHLFGTDNMSTRDIKSLFELYGPSHIEWINDSSCNVVWDDVQSATRALWALTEAIPVAEGEPEPVKEEFAWRQMIPLNDDEPASGLRVRLASTTDIKKVGAARKSKYYKKYGGGPSFSRKRKKKASNNGGGGKMRTELVSRHRRAEMDGSVVEEKSQPADVSSEGGNTAASVELTSKSAEQVEAQIRAAVAKAVEARGRGIGRQTMYSSFFPDPTTVVETTEPLNVPAGATLDDRLGDRLGVMHRLQK